MNKFLSEHECSADDLAWFDRFDAFGHVTVCRVCGANSRDWADAEKHKQAQAAALVLVRG